MAEKRHTGPAMSNAKNVTQRELIMKAKKPNFPDNGFHSLEVRISMNECSLNNNDDFHISPSAITAGKATISSNHTSIHKRLKRSVLTLPGLMPFID